MKNYNKTPWNDDFDSSKNYHQILFNPGLAVQSRELTQLQTILRDQIAKFGNHIFKHGSVVIPGNSYYELKVPYIKVNATFDGLPVSAAAFEGKTIVAGSVKAVVKKTANAEDSDPITLYLTYISGSAGGSDIIDANTEFYALDNSSLRATTISSSHSGFGSLAYVNVGVYYVSGTFVEVAKQSVVASKYTSTPTCIVSLKIDETVIDYNEDDTLLDPAQGSYNYGAPGADRVKITLTLVKRSASDAVSEDYIDLMKFDSGTLLEYSRYSKYSELEKSLARRTHDESGNYRVDGLALSLNENLKTAWNNGLYTNGDEDKITYTVSPGKAYIQGFEVETISDKRIDVDKARTPEHIAVTSMSHYTDYANYIYITDVHGLPSFKLHEQVQLKDPSNVTIGTCNAIALDYHSGDTTDNTTIYKLYYHDLNLTVGQSISMAKTVTGTSFSSKVLTRLSTYNASNTLTSGDVLSGTGNREATVWKHYIATGDLFIYRSNAAKYVPKTGDIVTAASGTAIVSGTTNGKTSSGIPLFQIPAEVVASVKNAGGTADIEYTIWDVYTITLDGAGAGSVTTSIGEFVVPEAGTVVALDSAGHNFLQYLTRPSNNVLSISGSPIVSTTVTVLAQVKRSTQPAKTKTLVTTTTSGLGVGTTVSLAQADIYKLISVTTNAGADVTSLYTLDNGQRDFYYDIGSISRSAALPVGTTSISVQFSYFDHSGSSDYFSVDSYTTLGASYLQQIPSYTPSNSNQAIKLSQVLDFRPKKTVGGFTTTAGLYSGSAVIDNIITSSIKYYMGRVDTVYLNKSGEVLVAKGIPSLNPVKVSVPDDVLPLHHVTLPPYTSNLDTVIQIAEKNQRYTMADIHKLADRISNVEYFSTLNAVENSLLQYEVIDAATGLNRFKTGYLVDNFENPTTICDYYNAQNTVSFTERNMSSAVDPHDTELALLTPSSGYKIIDGKVMLDYTETPLINQPLSTRTTNLNPFLVFSWRGEMTMTPAVDNFVDAEMLPEIARNVSETVTVIHQQRVPVPYNTSNWWEWFTSAPAISPSVTNITSVQQTVLSVNQTGVWVSPT